jgi:hypothetical protein
VASSGQYRILKRKWLKKHKEVSSRLWEKHKDALLWIGEKVPAKEKIASGAIGALMISNTLPGAIAAIPSATAALIKPKVVESHQNDTPLFVSALSAGLPDKMRPLSSEEENTVAKILSDEFKIIVGASFDGKKLNRSYGYIGAEQHLARFPGDAMAAHLGPNAAYNKLFYSSGMAPGLGAWGYFAGSKNDFSQRDIEREKWYIAVQTFDAPGYLENTAEYSKWFKYRKMLVVNPLTGQAVVCDIADAGPAEWTGKHLGGSPEVMAYLGLQHGPRKGAVLYFFINDPNDTIPLGPI